MITLYRRHLRANPLATPPRLACPATGDRFYKRCKCPMWAEGTTPTGYIRKSLGTNSWEAADDLRKKLEAGKPIVRRQAKRTDDAADRFLANKEVQGKAEGTVRIAKRRMEEFKAWCAQEGYTYLTEVDTEVLDRYRQTWTGGASTRAHKQGTIFNLFAYCLKMKWVSENPAANLSRIQWDDPEVDYFAPAEFDALIKAAEGMRGRKAARLKAFILVMRWSGLRILDVTTLQRRRITNGNLLLRTTKTGAPVYAPLPPFVLRALAEVKPLPDSHSDYFFWSKVGKPETAANVWRRSFMTAVVNSGFPRRGHPHMLRDTFAVEALLAGVPVDQVQRMLGHASVVTTERHYMPFVRARQDQLAESFRRMWPATA
jgi:site-specific recombinase XerD